MLVGCWNFLSVSEGVFRMMMLVLKVLMALTVLKVLRGVSILVLAMVSKLVELDSIQRSQLMMALPWPRGKGMLQVLIQYLLAAAFVS